jgi:hypothetical protein
MKLTITVPLDFLFHFVVFVGRHKRLACLEIILKFEI